MKIDVDLRACQGHGKCYLIAPDLFEAADDHGRATYHGGEIEAGGDAAERGDVAIASCPEQALQWSTQTNAQGSSA